MPTFKHGKGVVVLVDQYDFSAYFNDMSATTSVDTAETSTFGASAKTYVTGHVDGTISLGGYFESTALVGTDQYFASKLGNATKQKVIVMPGGHSNGARASMLEADTTSYEVTSPIGDVVGASAEFQATDGVEHGVVLSAGSAVSATGNTTGVDNGAATTNGGVGYLSVPTNTRNGNITVKIQSSADNSTFADLITFTVVSSATATSQRVEVTGSIPRYLRASYTVAGSTGSATPTVAFARR